MKCIRIIIFNLFLLITYLNDNLLIKAKVNSKISTTFLDNDEEDIIFDDKYSNNNSNVQSNSQTSTTIDISAQLHIDKNNINDNSVLTPILDLDSYLSQNIKLMKQTRILNLNKGECISSFKLNEKVSFEFNDNRSDSSNSSTSSNKAYFPFKNLNKLESIIDSRNINKLYNDDDGNILLVSISDTDNIKSKFIFISKIDFSYFIFPQVGDEIPNLKEFMIGHIFISSLNQHIIYIFGGIDYKGSYSNDLFSIEIDYNKQQALVKTFLSRNQKDDSNVPMGFTEGSISLIKFKKQNEYTEQVAVILYGGLTDIFINNDVFIFRKDKGWFKYKDLNLPKLKGISSEVIPNENPFELTGDISKVVLKNSIIIFGGRDEKDYNNQIIKLKITYVVFEDNFFIKQDILSISNKDMVIGRENHALLFDSKRRKEKNENILYLFGGKNFKLGKNISNEVFELNLKPIKTDSNGLKSIEWKRVPVKMKQKDMFVTSAVGFYFDGFLSLDENSSFSFSIFNSSCDSSCDGITMESNIVDEKTFEKEMSTNLIKIIKCKEDGKNNRKSPFVNDNLRNVENDVMDNDRISLIEKLEKLNRNNNGINSNMFLDIKNKIDKESKMNSQINTKEGLKSNTESKMKDVISEKQEDLILSSRATNNNKDVNNNSNNNSNFESDNISLEKPQAQNSNSLLKTKQKQKKQNSSRISNKNNYQIQQLSNELKSILLNTTQSDNKLIHKLLNTSESLKNNFNNINLADDMRFTQLKSMQLSLIREISDSEKKKSELFVNETLSKTEKKLSDINERISLLIELSKKNNKEELIKENNEKNNKLDLLLEKIKEVERINNEKLSIIEENQIESIKMKIDEVNFRKKVMTCVNGYLKGDNQTCTCYPGFIGNDCSQIAICEENCHGNGVCYLGKCFCNPGFNGDSCREEVSCLNDCSNNGLCKYGKCFCDAEFSGEDCSEKLKCTDNCNEKGICFKGKCLCEPGYFGDSCEKTNIQTSQCSDNCNNNGICSLGKCFCYYGFTGETCKTKIEFSCPPYNILSSTHNTSNSKRVKSLLKIKPCNGNGLCQYGKCFCYPGFTGNDCSEKYNCLENCNNNGICIQENKCQCNSKYTGELCNIRLITNENNFPNNEIEINLFNNQSKNNNNTLLEIAQTKPSSFIQIEESELADDNNKETDSNKILVLNKNENNEKRVIANKKETKSLLKKQVNNYFSNEMNTTNKVKSNLAQEHKLIENTNSTTIIEDEIPNQKGCNTIIYSLIALNIIGFALGIIFYGKC